MKYIVTVKEEKSNFLILMPVDFHHFPAHVF